MARDASPGSVYSVSSGEVSDYAPEPSRTNKPVKRARLSGPSKPAARSSNPVAKKPKGKEDGDVDDIEDVGTCVRRPHAPSYHAVDDIAALQQDLLDWFEVVREKRGMPWRKRYDSSLTMDQKGQRAYEIWVSEVMLQQTQVNTVISYWQRWIEKWPTIADLAKADIEDVNAAWRGLGYYRRARSLLEGAKTVMSDAKYQGRLPEKPDVLEKEIAGVGRYTAGAICSMAYGVRTPIVDGNIHRLLTRLLAVHAPQTAPATIKFLWTAAEQLVDSLPDDKKSGTAGDWNQALMELGSQVCKPVSPTCSECPLQTGCKAYAELKSAPAAPASSKAGCDLCAPIPTVASTSVIPTVTVFPMRKEKKVSREEEETVCLTEWTSGTDRKWLFVKRPEKGLLAGLFEPPTTPLSDSSAPQQRLEASMKTISQILDLPRADLAQVVSAHQSHGSIPHIFSHINMTYHVQHLVITSPDPAPTPTDVRAVWLDDTEVEHANVGTGVKKVWAEVFGSWGSFSAGRKPAKPAVKGKRKSEVVPLKTEEGKIVKKIMMPMMPTRKALEEK